MEINNRELRSTRELARETNSILEALSAGDLQKVVVMKGNKAAAVIVTVETFERLESSDKISP
jgi:hypothetical protein